MGDFGQGLAGLVLRVTADVLRGLRQGVANGLLLGQRLRTRGLPLLSQSLGHAVQRAGPSIQALLLRAALLAVLQAVGVAERGDQGFAALGEGLAEGVQGLAHALHHAGVGGLVLRQGLAVAVRHAFGGGVELGVQFVHMLLCAVQQALVHALRLLGQLRHGGLHHGAYAVAGQLHALAQAGAQRALYRLGQAGISDLRFLVKAVLVGQQALVDLLAGALHLRHHGLQGVLQLAHHLRQHLCLLLQRLVGFLPLVRQRKDA